MIPLYAPVFLLAAVCAFYPAPRWLRRVDWYVAGWWAGILAYCVVVWFALVWIIEWAAA